MTDQLLEAIGESQEPGETGSSLRHTAAQLEAAVADLFSVHDVTLGIQEQPETIRLRGHLQVDSEQAYPKMAARLAGDGLYGRAASRCGARAG